MKRTILTVACALVAPLAFAQTSTTTTERTTTAPGVTTTETTTTYDGTVTTFTPGKTIVVRREGVTEPVTYTLSKKVVYVTRSGREIKEIRPGVRVHFEYEPGETHVVNRIMVDQD
jgi:hypothetical protein